MVATICHLKDGTAKDLVEFFERAIQSELAKAGMSVLAYFVTENASEHFSGVAGARSGECLCLVLSFPDEKAYERRAGVLANSIQWKNKIAEEFTVRLTERPEILRLAPTPRSRLHG